MNQRTFSSSWALGLIACGGPSFEATGSDRSEERVADGVEMTTPAATPETVALVTSHVARLVQADVTLISGRIGGHAFPGGPPAQSSSPGAQAVFYKEATHYPTTPLPPAVGTCGIQVLPPADPSPVHYATIDVGSAVTFRHGDLVITSRRSQSASNPNPQYVAFDPFQPVTGVRYDVSVSGSAEAPAHTFASALSLPPKLEVHPSLAQPVRLVAHQDFVIQWDSIGPADVLIEFLSQDTPNTIVTCHAWGTDSAFVIPAAVVDMAPSHGLLSVFGIGVRERRHWLHGSVSFGGVVSDAGGYQIVP